MMNGESWRFWFAFGVLCIACALAGVMSVYLTINVNGAVA